jgi:hypothetical protein
MSIRTVDMQVMLPKASEVSRVQQIQQHENTLQQQDSASQIANQAVKTETTVNKTPRDEAALIRERQEKQKKQGKKGGNDETKQNNDNDELETKPGSGDSKGLRIDIRA